MKQLMLGNEAIARGLFEKGVTVVSSYPGTPSTEITEYAAQYPEIYAEWAPNEKVALEVAIGASIGGARAFCGMKHVGLNVAADPLFTASYVGVSGGLVVAVADDPGMHSSQNEQDSRHYAIAAKLPMLEPSDSHDALEFVKLAYNISEEFDVPVMIRLSTRVSHSQTLVEKGVREDYKLKEYSKNFQKYVMMPAMARKRHVAVEKRMLALKEYSEKTDINKIEWGSRDIGIITSGICYEYAKDVLPEASYLKLGMINPMPDRLIREFAAGCDKIYVIEELDDIIETHCLKIGISVVGKQLFSLLGELGADIIREKILGVKVNDFTVGRPLPVRPPVMCTGCPHRGMFYVLGKLKLAVSGDIGCYTLGALPPLASMDTCVCMGASIGMMHGFGKARGNEFAKNMVAVIGESTFIHSGITGLIDIAYNKGIGTVIILDNSITGMTGHQHNPMSGFTLKGEPTKQVDLTKLCGSIGIDRVRVVDPFDIEAFEKTVREEIVLDEPSVIISQRPCALLKHVKFDGQRITDSDKCTGCKICMKLGCPAITMVDKKMYIDKSLCVGCSLCEKVCKFGAIERASTHIVF